MKILDHTVDTRRVRCRAQTDEKGLRKKDKTHVRLLLGWPVERVLPVTFNKVENDVFVTLINDLLELCQGEVEVNLADGIVTS